MPNHHKALFLVCVLNDFIALSDAHHLNGSIGADFAISSTFLIRFFITPSIGHHPIVSESFTNHRIINIDNKSMIIILNAFCPASINPFHNKSV